MPRDFFLSLDNFVQYNVIRDIALKKNESLATKSIFWNRGLRWNTYQNIVFSVEQEQKSTSFFHFKFLDSYAFVLPKVHYQIILRISDKHGVYTTELQQ